MQAERHARILSLLEDQSYLGLDEAAQRLGMSRSTIWRDFGILASMNLAERTYGGIKRRSGDSASILPFDLRQRQCAEEKDAIARRAAQLLRPDDVFIADSGTTTYQLAAHLPKVPLTAVTISIPLVTALSKRKLELPTLEVVVIGGVYNLDLGTLIGPDVQESLSRIHAQWAFIGVDGVTEDGISNNNYLNTQSKIPMIRNSEKVVVLADHSKIGRRGMTQICGLDEIDMLITDEWSASGPVLEGLRRRGVEVVSIPQEESAMKVGGP